MYLIIIGAGRLGSRLAALASQDGHNVAVVEQEEKRARELSEKYDLLVIHADVAQILMGNLMSFRKWMIFCKCMMPALLSLLPSFPMGVCTSQKCKCNATRQEAKNGKISYGPVRDLRLSAGCVPLLEQKGER